MKALRVCIATLLLLPSGACLAAGAGPRASATSSRAPAVVPVEREVWLRRLVGTYDFDGMVEVVHPDYEEHRCGTLPPDPAQSDNPPPPPVPYCASIRGKGDCIQFGAGPGVQCVLGVTWLDIHDVTDEGVFGLPGGVSYLSPAMVLFGLGPGDTEISYLLADNKGLAEGGPGSVVGNRGTFSTRCVNAPALLRTLKAPLVDFRPPQDCDRVIRIDAKADSRVLHMSMDILINGAMFTRFEMTLRRVGRGR